jgi:DNA-binding HxlR family transcriptional regulator
LNKRLAELREALIVEHSTGQGYSLTDHGKALRKSLGPLYRWAIEWGVLFGVKDRH